MKLRQKTPKAGAAFTLIEVVLAVGIIAVAFLPLIGLLPIGLSQSRLAMDTTIESQIAQQLTTEFQQTAFSVLINPATATNFTGSGSATGTPSYFDDQGNKTTTANAIYEAGFAATTNTALPGGVTTQNLATVTIYILSITGSRTSRAADPTVNPDWKKFVVLIPDNGS